MAFQGYPLKTSKGLSFTYKVKGGELFFTRKEKSITRSTVDIAFQKALELGEKATGPKKLGVFGASYLYPVFVRLGVINKRWQMSRCSESAITHRFTPTRMSVPQRQNRSRENKWKALCGNYVGGVLGVPHGLLSGGVLLIKMFDKL